MKKHKHISRIDTDRTRCWFHRRVINGEQQNKTFTDGVYGGKLKAHQAAVAYDHQLDLKYGKHTRLGQVQPIGIKSNITNRHSDKAGVCLVYKKRISGQWEYSYAYWTATWRDNGTRCQESFSCNAHGFDTAYRKAVRRRNLEVKRMVLEGKKLRRAA